VTYTQLAVSGVVAALLVDLLVLRVRLLRRPVFWVAYAIVVFFQLLTNGFLTGREIVTYSPDATLSSGQVVLLGDWRIAYAPVEDLLFGFALILFAMDWWVWWGRRGLQREPYADGPWQRYRDARLARSARP
jgi:lycopene cyclase domain-containing protein